MTYRTIIQGSFFRFLFFHLLPMGLPAGSEVLRAGFPAGFDTLSAGSKALLAGSEAFPG